MALLEPNFSCPASIFFALNEMSLMQTVYRKKYQWEKYQVEYGTILVLCPIGTFSINNRKKYHVVLNVTSYNVPKKLSISYILTRLKVVLTKRH